MARPRFKLAQLLIVLIICLLAAGGYWFYEKSFNRPLPGIKVIPSSSLLFAEITDINSFKKTLLAGNDIWNAFTQIVPLNNIDQQIRILDSAFRKNPSVDDLITGSKVFISIHHTGSDSLRVLFIVELPDVRGNNLVKNFITGAYGSQSFFNEILYKENKLIEVNVPEYSSFYFATRKGNIIISADPELVISGISQSKNKDGIDQSASFRKVIRTAGKRVDALLFINLEKADILIKTLTQSGYHHYIALLKDFAAWCELDLLIKEDEILLNGYTDVVDSTRQYMNVLRGQKQQQVNMTKLLPYNTNCMLWFGIEDFSMFYHRFEDYLRYNNRFDNHYNSLHSLNNRYKIDVEKNLTSWIGKEFAFASLGRTMNEFKEKSFGVFHTSNPERANQLLTQIMHHVNGSSIISSYNEHLIKKINIPELIPMVFGKEFSNLSQTYFTIISNYVIFANNKHVLREIINTYLSGKTLNDNINYKEFSDNIAEHSNFYLYYNSRNALQAIKSYLPERLKSVLTTHETHLNSFHAFALQFSYINQMFYTNIYLKYNPGYREENRALWKTELDSKIISRPYLVKDHTDKTYNIIVFDEDNQIILLDNNGNILWKIPLSGQVISEVYPVDFYKNRKIQYLFNTTDNLYLIDLLGRNVENYPIQLGSKATNGLSVFDYIRNKEYRIVFACEDNRVYNYDLKGNSIRGWKKPRTDVSVLNETQHLVAENKDYIIIPLSNGSVKITDRKGDNRIRIRDDFKNAINSDFYVNKTNSKGPLITTDQNGHLVYIKTNGRIDRTVFGDFSPGHFFIYEDFDKNGKEDFIFVDGKQLIIFDRFKNILFEYGFENEIRVAPQLIPLSYRESLLGVVDTEGNTLYLFDKKGNQVFGTGMVGETPFEIGSLNDDDNLNLIVASGSTLYNYLLQ